LETCLHVTAAFETRADPFKQITGNFDGAGLSFGPVQFNFISGTLPRLVQRFQNRDETLLRDCFDSSKHYDELLSVLELSSEKQIEWADDNSRGNNKKTAAQPWKRIFNCIGAQAAFQDEMIKFTNEVYGGRLNGAVQWLESISGYKINHLRCISALFDCCIQQGGLERAQSTIHKRLGQAAPADAFEMVRIAVDERARTAQKRWRADCLSRRLSILHRQTVPVSIDGHHARRANLNLCLLRDVNVDESGGFVPASIRRHQGV